MDTGRSSYTPDGAENTAFAGAKLALFLGHELLVLRRDATPGIPYPDHLDLPGGGREGGETPAACVLRETREEIGLELPQGALGWSRAYRRPHGTAWFFAAHLPAGLRRAVRFGDEGRYWTMMRPAAFVAHPEAVPHFRTQLSDYLAQGMPGRDRS